MSAPEQYRGSEHPLARIHALQLTAYFERRACSIVCPRCGKTLQAFHYKPTWGIGFFVCAECAWFHARPCLFEILKKAEQPQVNKQSAAAIHAALDRVAGKVLPAEYRPQPFYKRLSGGRRSAKPTG